MSSAENRYVGSNQTTVRRNNQAVIYKAIWDLGPISRSEVAAQTGLHAATITHIVENLKKEGLVKETGIGESTVGRPPIHLEIEPEAAYVMGVHLGRDGARAILTDLRGRPVEQLSLVGHRGAVEGETALKRLTKAVRLMLDLADSSGYRVAGVGVGVPGPVEPVTGVVRRSPNWSISETDQSLPLGQMLSEQIGLPVFVDNNANASALAELHFGTGRTVRNFLYIAVGFGVGGGVIINGSLYHGFLGGAGEVGHMMVDPAGPPCACGNVGCLELYASLPAIMRRAAAAMDANAEDLTPAQVAEAYRRGHAGVAAVIGEVAVPLAHAVTNLMYVLSPEAVVLGGLLAELAPVLAEQVQQAIRQRVFSIPSDQIRVVGPSVPCTPVLGPATLALEAIINSGTIHLG